MKVKQLPSESRARAPRCYCGIEAARFKRPVEPGDQLILEAELLRMKAGIFKFKVRALVDGDLAVEAELTCAMRKVG